MTGGGPIELATQGIPATDSLVDGWLVDPVDNGGGARLAVGSSEGATPRAPAARLPDAVLRPLVDGVEFVHHPGR